MKRLFTITSIIFLMTNIFGKGYIRYNQKPLLGINVYQASTGSGYGSSININLNVQKLDQQFEVGAMLNAQNKAFAGIEFMFMRFTSTSYNHTIRPFFLYNFIFRSQSEVIDASSRLATSNSSQYTTNGKATTFEHAIGLGMQLKIAKMLYVNGSTGFSAYMGNLGRQTSSIGFHGNNFGIVPSLKIGFGYKF